MRLLKVLKICLILISLISCRTDQKGSEIKNSFKSESIITCSAFFDFYKMKKLNNLSSIKTNEQISFSCIVDSISKIHLTTHYKNVKIYIEKKLYLSFALGIDDDDVYSNNFDNFEGSSKDLFFSFDYENKNPISFSSNTFPFKDLEYKAYFEDNNQKVIVIKMNYKMHGKKPKWEVKELHFKQNCGLTRIVVKDNESNLYYHSPASPSMR